MALSEPRAAQVGSSRLTIEAQAPPSEGAVYDLRRRTVGDPTSPGLHCFDSNHPPGATARLSDRLGQGTEVLPRASLAFLKLRVSESYNSAKVACNSRIGEQRRSRPRPRRKAARAEPKPGRPGGRPGRWRSAAFLRRIRRPRDDLCLFCSAHRRMTRSLLHFLELSGVGRVVDEVEEEERWAASDWCGSVPMAFLALFNQTAFLRVRGIS